MMNALMCKMLTTLVVLFALLLSACAREKRPLNSQLKTPEQYEENAYAVSQGKNLFRTFNCAGCHAQGGGGMGPPLIDPRWRYGGTPQDIYATIMGGRPNGMPSFAGRIPEDYVWQLVAYVRSMSGQLRFDIEPSRSDSLQASEPEQRRPKLPLGVENVDVPQKRE
jgi:cytochrome c oxidase cbb3-type subunit 3